MQNKLHEKDFKNEKISPYKESQTIKIDNSSSPESNQNDSLKTQKEPPLYDSILIKRDCFMVEAIEDDEGSFSDKEKYRNFQTDLNDAILNYRKKLIYSIREENAKFIEGLDEDAEINTYFGKLQVLLKELYHGEKFAKREDFWLKAKDSYTNFKQIARDILNYNIESPTIKYISYLALSLSALLLSATILSLTACTNRFSLPFIEKLSAALRSSNIFKFVTIAQSLTIGIGATYSYFFQNKKNKLSKELRVYLKELNDLASVHNEEAYSENIGAAIK